jgi:hypothetical protein
MSLLEVNRASKNFGSLVAVAACQQDGAYRLGVAR